LGRFLPSPKAALPGAYVPCRSSTIVRLMLLQRCPGKSLWDTIPFFPPMMIRILYDNEAPGGMLGAHGFACQVGEGVLFDTGGELALLKHNMGVMGLSAKTIDTVVISHDHWDHQGGLDILSDMGETRVLLPRSVSGRLMKRVLRYPNAEIVEVFDPFEIKEGIWTTGELGKGIGEQSLVVRSEEGLTVITGCAHPGVANILQHASRLGRVRKLIGGLHDFDQLHLLEDLDLVVPCHCSVMKERILQRFPERSIPCHVGLTLDV
jgi:7,8-dihydropterin-6-yl-methyl-4-(beta-D-ribofuranosyl)aminobenzene 5'-phosphate synthase